MYSVTQQDKVAAQGKRPLQKSFYASSLPSSNSTLHFSYRLVDLQKEIEKRTFYLGKYRNTEGAAHLMDLIGMSRDEGDLLYPFAKAAMADVYDQLNMSALHIPKKYEWKDLAQPIILNEKKDLEGKINQDDTLLAEVSRDKKSIIIKGSVTVTEPLPAKSTPVFSCGVDYETTYKVIGSNVEYTTTKSIGIPIPKEYIRKGSGNEWNVIPYTCNIPLDPQSNITTEEVIKSCIVGGISNEMMQYDSPITLKVGDVVSLQDVSYEIIEDTNENILDLSTQAVMVDQNETMNEGIHYYFSVPNYLNMSSVDPLDNAIMEALVNRIIWKPNKSPPRCIWIFPR